MLPLVAVSASVVRFSLFFPPVFCVLFQRFKSSEVQVLSFEVFYFEKRCSGEECWLGGVVASHLPHSETNRFTVENIGEVPMVTDRE